MANAKINFDNLYKEIDDDINTISRQYIDGFSKEAYNYMKQRSHEARSMYYMDYKSKEYQRTNNFGKALLNPNKIYNISDTIGEGGIEISSDMMNDYSFNPDYAKIGGVDDAESVFGMAFFYGMHGITPQGRHIFGQLWGFIPNEYLSMAFYNEKFYNSCNQKGLKSINSSLISKYSL